MFNKLKKVVLFTGLIFIIPFFFHGKASAVFFNGYNETDIVPTRSDTTNWQIKMTYYNVNADIQAGPLSVYMMGGTSGNHYYVWQIDGKPDTGDYITWHTACVDPNVAVTTNALNTPDGRYYTTTFDAGCHYGVQNAKYAGCYNLSGSVSYNNWRNPYTGSSYSGGVPANGQCPYYQTSASYCTIGGVTQYGYNNSYTSNSLCGASTCGGTGSCTRYTKYCNGNSYCYRPSTAYSTSCGGSAISGTSMCTTTSSTTCSPPAPVVTATSSCNGSIPQISANWTAPSYSSGAYDLRWRVAGGTFTNVCTPAKPFVISSGLTSGTTYEIQVRGNTTSGHNGPTDFGSDTVVAASCIPPPTCSLAASPTSIYQGGTSALTTTGVAGAGGGSITYSYPAPSTGTTDNVTTSTSTYHAPASVGSTTTATVYAKTCNTIGGACTTCSTPVTVQATNSITVNVYQDLNGNGLRDNDSNGNLEPGYNGTNIITITGLGAGNYSTGDQGVAGRHVISGLLTGNSSVNITVPQGFIYSPNQPAKPRSISLPPSQTVNFGIKPPPPTCTLTANPVTVNPGQTSALTATVTSGGQGQFTYTWLTPQPGSYTTTNPLTAGTTGTATWQAPSNYWTDTYAYPSVQVCQAGSALCSSCAVTNGGGVGGGGVHIVPIFSVSGNVFVDDNKDGIQNNGETNYTAGSITVTPNPSAGSISYNNGNFTITNVPGGNYTITYNGPPSGFILTRPKPAVYSITVGNASTGGACAPSANCDANGNLTGLKFGISDSIPWIQCIGGDCTGTGVTNPGSGGFTDKVPQGPTCGSYASLPGSGGSPGIIYSGSTNADFGKGQASAYLNGSTPPYNWVVGSSAYPEPINVSFPLASSYASAKASLTTITALSNSQCGAGGINNCTLAANIASGAYTSNGNLTLTGGAYTFPGNTSSPKNFIFLVNGDLNINTDIHVPVGDTAFFSATGNINVGANVGNVDITQTCNATTHAGCNIEGYFSTDKSFIVLGNNACPVSDLRLNVAGSIVVNAVNAGGIFDNRRDLCAGNLQCPAFSITERPDFVLYSPEFLKVRRVWQEVAP